MEYEAYDSSGTDDDLPPSHQNRIARGGHIAANGRPVAASVPYPRMYGETDMESQIHQLEQEAYSSVLRAFKAQSDAITWTWEKESLITELRKELRLSNEEHRELLGRVTDDDMIRRIREWRQASGLQSSMLNTSQSVPDPIPSPTVSASRKKQKITSSVLSESFGGPSPSFHPQTVSASHQPSSSAAKRGPVPGPKGKKQKPVYVGDRPTFKNPANPLRGDSRFKLKGVPTLFRWEKDAISSRLEDNEAHLPHKIDALLAANANPAAKGNSAFISAAIAASIAAAVTAFFAASIAAAVAAFFAASIAAGIN